MYSSECVPWHADASLMSNIASAHGGDDHDKASSFMSETLQKVHAKPCLPGLSCMPGLAGADLYRSKCRTGVHAGDGGSCQHGKPAAVLKKCLCNAICARKAGHVNVA